MALDFPHFLQRNSKKKSMSAAVSRISPRVELGGRPLVRHSPQRYSTPERKVHNGLVFPNGTIHTGGKAHANAPVDHPNLIGSPSSHDPPTPTPIFVAGSTLGRHIQLPSTRVGTPPRRPTSPAPQQSPGASGRRYIPPADHGDVVGHSFGTPTRDRPTSKQHVVQRDNIIVGISITEKNVTQDSPSRPRGRLYMEGPPEFVPDKFVPRPYTPQLRKVDSKPSDNGIFASSPSSSLRQDAPVRCGKARIAPPQSDRINPITGTTM